MPSKFTSESLYPINQLNKLAASDSPPSAYSAVDTNKFFALDLKENSGANHSTKNKRKFISVNLLDNKLQIVSHSKKELAKVLESNKKEEILLVFYVKTSEKNEFEKEIKSKLSMLAGLTIQEKINEIIKHFRVVWKNFTPFPNYHNILEAYDQHSGEPILKAANKVGEIYLDIKKSYEDLKKQYGERPEKFQKILAELESIVGSMEKEYENNRDRFQHLSIGSIASVIKFFEKKKEKFEGEAQQLKKEDSNDERNEKLKLLKDRLVTLQTDCEKVIPKKAACTEKMFEERKEIKNEIELLFVYIEDLIQHVVISDETIAGLDDKLNNLENKLLNFKSKVNAPLMGSQNNNEKENEQRRQMENYFAETLQPKLTIITNHSKKTSPEKAGVLNNILLYIRQLKEMIDKKESIVVIKDKIKKIKEFIDENISKLSISTGKFFNPVSPGLVNDLSSKLDHLVPETIVNDPKQSVVLRS